MAELGEPLSERELDVLRGLAVGSLNKDIADSLSISPYTVKTHLRNIYAKLGVSTRTEAITVAIQQGLLALPGVDSPEKTETTTSADTGPAATVTDGPHSSDIPAPAPSHRWRNLSLALLLLLALAGGFVLLQWRGNGLAAATATATVMPYEEQPIGDTRWLTSRPLPSARTQPAAAAVGLDIYVIGGLGEEGVLDTVSVFNSRERVWRAAAGKPTAVSATMGDELFGEIYVPGGLVAGEQPTDIVEAYSPTQNAWRRVAPLPQPVAGGVAVAEGGFLYVLGGWNGQQVLDTAYVYDPAGDTWRPLAPLPAPRMNASGDSLTGQIYLVGGSDGLADQSTCFIYSPPDDIWDECPEMLQPRAGAGATVLLNKLYLIGGTSDSATGIAQGELFDPNTNTWTVLNMPPGQTPWLEPGVVHVENRVYVMGGRQGDAFSDANLVYAPFVYQTFIPAASSDDGDE